MAADCIASITIDRRESDVKLRPQRTASGDGAERGNDLESNTFARLLERCDGVCTEPDAYIADSTAIMKALHILPQGSPNHNYTTLLDASYTFKELLCCEIPLVQTTSIPPPTYQEALGDEPPKYALREDLGQQELVDRIDSTPCSLVEEDCEFLTTPDPRQLMPSSESHHFEEPSGIISYSSRKAKNAQKAAGKAKWADDGKEGNKDGGEGEENGGDGGGGGGDAPGGGGDNNGDGGDDWGAGGDYWNQGSGKKKKKGKKQQEGEDKKKREEEEEEEARKKEEENTNDNVGGDTLSWANEGETKADDDWGTFAAGKIKKDKQKKGEADSLTNTNPTGGAGAFADIALVDDIPKIDINFGTTKDDKTSSSGFSLGSWGNGIGSSWGLSGAKTTNVTGTRGFNAINEDSIDIAATNSSKDAKTTSTDAPESSWSFGSNKKNKKKEASSFDFGNLGADGDKAGELGFGETGESNHAGGADPDPWPSTVTTAGKKGGRKDRNKKGAIEEIPEDEVPVVNVPPKDETTDTYGGFGGWAMKKKDKVIEVPPPPPPAPVAPVDDAWSTPTTVKGKKKKNGAIEESSILPTPPIQVVDDDPPVDAVGDDGWPAFSFDGDKKKSKKKGGIDVILDDPPVSTAFNIGFGTTNDEGFGFGTKKSKIKKGKGAIEEVQNDDPISMLSPVTTNDTTAAESNDRGNSSGIGAKKNTKPDKTKKGVKAPDAFLPPPPLPVPVTSNFDFFDAGADTGVDHGWGSWDAKNKKKDNLLSFNDDIDDVPIMEDDREPEADPFAGLSPKERKKKERELEREKEKKEKEEERKEKGGTTIAFDSGWGTIGSKDKKKEKSMSFGDEFIDVPQGEDKVEQVMDPLAGLTGNAKRKKEKELKEAKEKANNEAVEQAEAETVDPLAGLLGPARKKKGKELEKEKKEKEKIEKAEKEKAVKEQEEKEAREKAEQEAAAADPLAGLLGATRRKKEKELREAKEKSDREAAEQAAAELSPADPLAGLYGATRKKREKELEKERLEKEKLEKEKLEKEKKDQAEVDPFKGSAPLAKKKKEKESKEAERIKAREEEKRLEEEREKELEKERELEAERVAAEQKEKEKRDKKAGATKSGWGSSFMDAKSMWGPSTTETEPEPSVNDFLSGSNDLAGLDAGGEDDWGSPWAKPDTGKKKKVGRKEVAPPPAPTPPAQGLTPEPEAPLDDVMSWDTGGFSSFGAKSKSKIATSKSGLAGKDGLKSSVDKSIDLLSALDNPPLANSKDLLKKTISKEETPAKTTSRFGGWGFGSTLTKDKLAKEKVAQEEEERLAKEMEAEVEDDALLNLVDEEIEPEPAKPAAKKGKGSKIDSKTRSSPTATKSSVKTIADKTGAKSKDAGKDASEDKDKDREMTFDELLDLDGELDDGALNEYAEELEAEEKTKSDTWNFWGAKKPAGPKGDEMKREITKSPPANQKGSLSKADKKWKELEATTAAEEAFPSTQLDESKSTVKASTKDKSSMLGSKASTGKQSVVEKVKALEKERLAKEAAKSPAPPPPPAPEPQQPVADLPSAKTGSTSKPKGRFATKTSSISKKTKDLPSLSPFDEPDTVPGSFPSENLIDGLDDDDDEIIDFEPVVKKASKKTGKVTKTSKMAPTVPIIEAPMPPSAPPTPPPETPAAKPVKKERARVVRDPGATSWGLWGATPKKAAKPAAAKAKDDASVASPPAKKSPPKSLARSKSTKTPKEIEKERTVRSSGSDQTKKPPTSRPASKARGSSFSFFRGPPPARANKPPVSRRNSTAARSVSRRQSVDVAAAPTGIPSPPPDDLPQMTDKAAKIFGKVNGKATTKTKSKVPDPYAIDSDDNVLINTVEDPVINAPIPKTRSSRPEKPSRSKTKREPKYAPEPAGEDIIMVEADAFADEVNGGGNGDGYENVYPQKSRDPPPPAPLKRSATSATRRPNGLMGGLFGFSKPPRRQTETYDKPKSRSVYPDEPEPTPRKKRTVAGRDDDPKRLRREDRKVRRSDRDVEVDGFTTDAPPVIDQEAEDAEARRADRRARRSDRDARAKAAEDRADGEKKARDLLSDKAATDARKAKIRELKGLAPKFDEALDGEERDRDVFSQEERPSRRKGEDSERRRNRDRSEREPREKSSRREKALPTRTATEEADRRARHDELRSSRRTSERPSGSRRKSTIPAAPAPADNYFDSRNAAPDTNPYSHEAPRPSGNPHTASWVESLEADQPEPPPVAETVLDPPPGDDVKDEEEEDEEEARRRRRPERRRRKEGAGSGGSGEGRGEREKSRGRGGRREIYEAPTSRPGFGGLGGAGRRESWFSKITSF